MNKISRCNICGEFFNSKRELKEHKDKNHRITDSKVVGESKKNKKKIQTM
ncbi:MAG: hypothetical protein M3239_05050 [Thermoproteota archaeon]|nr:hypothetical protein [Thermoproteota archaeon]